MVEILDQMKLQEKIRTNLLTTNESKFAVAFWGEGASSFFSTKNNSTIIFNLEMGGTNPFEIEKIMSIPGIKIWQNNKLHSKVYIFDETVIVGSSNMSANGLCLEGKELSGWNELNLSTNDTTVRKDIEVWFSHLLATSNEVNKNDLAIAKKKWLDRRRKRPVGSHSEKSFVAAFKNTPEIFRDRKIFIVIYMIGKLSQDAKIMFNQFESERTDSNWDCWENWEDLPSGSTVLDFSIGKNGALKYRGIYGIPEENHIIKSSKTSITICFRKKDINGFKVTKEDEIVLKTNLNKIKNDYESGLIPIENIMV